jgi:hypothetical protein
MMLSVCNGVSKLKRSTFASGVAHCPIAVEFVGVRETRVGGSPSTFDGYRRNAQSSRSSLRLLRRTLNSLVESLPLVEMTADISQRLHDPLMRNCCERS